MALAGTVLPFGMRDVKLTAYTDASATTLAGSSQDLPYSQTFSFTESEDYEDLRGDDKLVTSHGKGAQIDWELGAGGITLEAYAILAGGAVTTSGVTPNLKKTYTKLVTDTRPFFKAEGQAISDSGGDFHAVVYRARATGDIEGGMEDGKFWVTSAKGTGFASNEASSLNKLYDFVQNETAVTIA